MKTIQITVIQLLDAYRELTKLAACKAITAKTNFRIGVLVYTLRPKADPANAASMALAGKYGKDNGNGNWLITDPVGLEELGSLNSSMVEVAFDPLPLSIVNEANPLSGLEWAPLVPFFVDDLPDTNV